MGLGIRTFLRQRLLVPRDKFIVLTLHQSTGSFDPKHHCPYTWSQIDALEDNLKYLASFHDVIPLMDGISLMGSGSIKGTKISITFDDGDRSISTHIVPLLQKHKIPATFFINSAYLDHPKRGYWFNIYNYLRHGDDKMRKMIPQDSEKIIQRIRNTFDPAEYDRLRSSMESLDYHLDDHFKPYAGLPDLGQLDTSLFTLGLHGHEHQRYSMMPAGWKVNDLKRNLEIISALPGFIPVFALPFGKSIDIDQDTREICRDLGLHIALSDNGYNTGPGPDIKRIPSDGKEFKRIINNLEPLTKNKNQWKGKES